MPRSIFSEALSCHKKGRLKEAERLYLRVLSEDPDNISSLINLGAILRRQGKLFAAKICAKKALRLKPNDPGAMINLGNVLRELGEYDTAEETFNRFFKTKELKPRAEDYFNFGLVFFCQNRMTEALEYFDRAISLNSNDLAAHWHKSLALLYLGHFENGFEEYEWRLALREARPNNRFPLDKRWRGQDLKGKKILITAEQGFGDSIQFSRFIPLLKERQATVIVETLPHLMKLTATTLAVDRVVSKPTTYQDYDYFIPLLSIPYVLSLGSRAPRIPADCFNLDQLGTKGFTLPFFDSSNMKIGVIWSGKLTPKNRSCPLIQFSTFFELPGIIFYSLQVGDAVKDISAFGLDPFLVDLSNELKSFSETAMAMTQLDLIITIDTAGCHLAGALGLPVWIMLTEYADWRWGREDKTPWYPSAKLFRQKTEGDWSHVLNSVKSELAELLRQNEKKIASCQNV